MRSVREQVALLKAKELSDKQKPIKSGEYVIQEINRAESLLDNLQLKQAEKIIKKVNTEIYHDEIVISKEGADLHFVWGKYCILVGEKVQASVHGR